MRIGTLSERLHVYERLGRCYELLRRWSKAQEAYENLLETARKAGNREVEWDALIRLAMLATDMTMDPETDDETFRGVRERAEQEAEEDGGRERLPGGTEPFEWSPSYALERAEEALSLAQEIGHRDLIAHSAVSVALLGVFMGRWEGVASGAAEARSLYAAMDDRALEAEWMNLSAWGEAMIGRPQEAVRSGRESRTAARELGDKDFYLADLHGLVLALLEVGEYEEALSVARTGVQAARSLGSLEHLHPSLLLLGDASRVLFRLEEARATYTEMTASVNIPQQHALTHSKLCAVAALEGDWEEAHTHALEAARLRGEVVLQLTAPLHFHYEVEALVRGGDDRDLAREEKTGEMSRPYVSSLSAGSRTKLWVGRWIRRGGGPRCWLETS